MTVSRAGTPPRTRYLVYVFFVSWFAFVHHGEVLAAPAVPENVEWRLVKLGDAPAPRLPGGRQPTLRLDPSKKQAVGYSGCNNFFGSYDLGGSSLKFGPLATTRRACPDSESAVETKYLEALAKVRGWKLASGEFLLVADGKELAQLIRQPVDTTTPNLETLTLHSKAYTAGPVTLTHGEYRAPAVPGSASEVVIKLTDHRASATLARKETAVIIVATSLGGSGSFYELALLSREAKGWVSADTVLLGDRVKVQSVSIENNVVVVSMTTHGPKDPMCCPTQQATKRFAIRNGKLAAVEQKTDSANLLVGMVWQWVYTRYNNDQKTVPAKPVNYTLRFTKDGQVNVKADCNQKSGTYVLEGKKLTIKLVMSTMAACEPGSLEDEFVRNLTAATISFFKDGDLYLDLTADTGTMQFTTRQ